MQMNDTARETYLMVLPVAFHRTAEGRFASESAFAEHLRLLKRGLDDSFGTLVVAGTELPREQYEALKSSWVEIDEREEGIRFHALHSSQAGHAEFLKQLPKLLLELYGEVKQARVVHAGPAFLYRPVSIASLVLGAGLGKVTISVTDIDNRESAWMNYQTGRWSKRQYWTTRLVHHTSDHLQHLFVSKVCSLVLLKGKRLADDYGQNKPNVKNFLDSAYGPEHIIAPADLETKLARLENPAEPLRLTYFGRLVAYKGIDHMLRALREASAHEDFRASFDVYGDGPEREKLTALSRELGLEAIVRFHGAIAFGPEFFRTIQNLHVLLAAPLSQDTPRSALDAQASGLFVLAYDTYYYQELVGAGAAVDVVPWPDAGALAARLVQLNRDRAALSSAIRRGVEFSRHNTQDHWLEKRFAWTRAALEASIAHARA